MRDEDRRRHEICLLRRCGHDTWASGSAADRTSFPQIRAKHNCQRAGRQARPDMKRGPDDRSVKDHGGDRVQCPTSFGGSTGSWSGEDQVTVAEFVPEIAVLQRACVAVLHESCSGDGFEDLEVGGLRLVPAGQQPVNCPDTSIG